MTDFATIIDNKNDVQSEQIHNESDSVVSGVNQSAHGAWQNSTEAADAIDKFLHANNLEWTGAHCTIAEIARYATIKSDKSDTVDKISKIYNTSLADIITNAQWSKEQKDDFLSLMRSGSGKVDAIDRIQLHATEPDSHRFPKLYKAAQICLCALGFAVSAASAAIGSPHGAAIFTSIFSTALESNHIAPMVQTLNQYKAFRVIKAVKDVVLSKSVRRVFKLTMGIVCVIAASNPIGFAFAVAGLSVTCVKAIYSTVKDVGVLRKRRSFERSAMATNNIAKAKSVRNAALDKLESIGIAVQKELNTPTSQPIPERKLHSKLALFGLAVVDGIMESAGAIVRLISQPTSVIEGLIVGVFAPAGAGESVVRQEEHRKEIEALTSEILRAGGKVPCNPDILEQYAAAHKEKTKALLELSENAAQLPKERVQEQYDVINKQFEEQIQAPIHTKSLTSRAMAVIQDIMHVHKPKNPVHTIQGRVEETAIERVGKSKGAEEVYYNNLQSKMQATTTQAKIDPKILMEASKVERELITHASNKSYPDIPPEQRSRNTERKR